MRIGTSNDDLLSSLRDLEASLLDENRRLRARVGLGSNDLAVLRMLVDADPRDPVTPRRVALALGISSAATTALVDRLESADLLERRPHESDRRSIVLAPTSHGITKVVDELERAEDRRAAALDGLSAAERLTVAGAFRAISRAISAPAEVSGQR